MGGLLSAYYLPGRWQRADALAKEPQAITLHDLATNGPGDNPHVIVTEFTCGSGYVFEIETRKGAPPPGPDQAGHGKAWIPLYPKSAPENANAGVEPTSFIVLLETTPTLASGNGFHVLSRRQSMEGIVVPLSRRDLPADVRDKLAERYPDTHFADCLILEQYEPYEKEDASTFATALAVIAGAGLPVGLLALSLGVILGRSRWKQICRLGTGDRAKPGATPHQGGM